MNDQSMYHPEAGMEVEDEGMPMEMMDDEMSAQ
jgi:hypothetical protein